MSRPEHFAPPEIFYNDAEAQKYTSSSRIQSIQSEMASRCLELLALPPSASAMLLDIGCGSGLSGEVLEEAGHEWVGLDISGSMLEVALEREASGDLFLNDMGHGLPFRPGSFDGCISVSALQWLCNSDSTAPSSSPALRLSRFFTTLFAALSRGSKAVFQFYPECDDQVRFIMDGARKAGFGGGLVVDYPNSQKAKKFYLVLMTGSPSGGGGAKAEEMPKALGVDDGRVDPGARKVKSSAGKRSHGKGAGAGESKKVWIQRKKDLYRSRGKEDVPRDSKFTGRKRRTQF